MKRFLGAVLLIVLTQTSSFDAQAADVPAQFSPAVKKAEIEGRALFEAFTHSSYPDSKSIEVAKKRITDFCDFKYVPLEVKLEDKSVIFFIAESENQSEIIFGRHYRVEESTVTPSTITCYASGENLPGTEAALITHLLSPTPSEFHVFLSLEHKMPIIVATKSGNWVIDDGKVVVFQAKNR